MTAWYEVDTTAVYVIVTAPRDPLFLSVGDTMQLDAVLKNAERGNISTTFTWASTTPSVCTINASTGIVTAVGVGSGSVTATATGGTVVTFNLEVVASQLLPLHLRIDDYAVTSSSYTPSGNSTVTISAQARKATVAQSIAGKIITWSFTGAGGSVAVLKSITNSSGIATVVFTVGVSGITHTVTATDEDGISGTSNNIIVS